MSHKLVSNRSVIYNADTLQSSVLTIICPILSFINEEKLNGQQTNHIVNIDGKLFADYNTNAKIFLNNLNYNVSEAEWNDFYDQQTFSSIEPFDKDMECALLYIENNLNTMYGLTQSDWIFEI